MKISQEDWKNLVDAPEAILLLETEVFPFWLPKCRWFAGKAQKIQSTRVQHLLPLPRQAWLVILEVYAEPGTSAEYAFIMMPGGLSTDLPEHAIISDTAADFRMVDALFLEEFREQWYHLMAVSSAQKFLHVELQCKSVRPLPSYTGSRLSGAEQSNTSVIYGDAFMLKFFRRLQRGIHPEDEITAHLGIQSVFHRYPESMATIHLKTKKHPYLLGIMQPMLRNQGDAWSWLAYETDALLNAELQGDSASWRKVMKPSLKEVLANMGKRSAEMHIGLSSPGISFGSEALSATRVSSIISSAHQQFDKVNKMVQSGAHRQDFIASGLPQLAGLMTFLRSIIDEYGQDLLEYPSIRIHGDYHLGQVLVDKQDVWILDFEGEPSKSLDDRRAHYPAVRDVAGMLRSFSYACHAAYFRISQPTQALSESLSALENAYIQIFLESYLKTTGENPVLYPAAFRRVLRFFLLDKALYELDYEWNNRPEWLRIPIAGLLQLYATVHVNPR